MGTPPSTARIIVVAVLSILASLGADAALVEIGTSLFPSINGYSHFRFFDYAALTIVGVSAACAAWPVVLRITSAPRGLFFRLAIVVTLALWLPDLYLLVKHEPLKAVTVLMAMHLVIALITYNLLVHLAASRNGPSTGENLTGEASLQLTEADLASVLIARGPAPAVRRFVWIALMSGVGVEFALGLAALLFVPFARPNEWLSTRGEAVYLCHAIVGGALGLGAMAVLLPARHDSRPARLGALVGLVGIGFGAAGGLLAVDHRWRLLGMALMLVGAVIAFFGYLTPIIEAPPSEESARLLESSALSGDAHDTGHEASH